MPALLAALPGLIRSAHTADTQVYPNPPLLRDWTETGVAPNNFIRTALPKDSADSWTAGEIDDMSDAIEAMFATEHRCTIGAIGNDRLLTRINRTIKPSGTETSTDRQNRVIDIFGEIRADGTATDYSEILSLDRVKGTLFTVTFSGGNTVNWTGHGRPIGAIITFINNGGNVLPTGLTKSLTTDTASEMTAYYVSAASYATNSFRLSSTRAGALAGTGTVTFTGTGTGTHKAAYGTLPGHTIDLDIAPVPTSAIRVMLDMGNTRYSSVRGLFRLSASGVGGGFANMAGLGVTGDLNLLTAGGAGVSNLNCGIYFGSLGYGLYVTPQWDSPANDYLSDAVTGCPIDLMKFDGVDVPITAAGNSADACHIRRLVIANEVGGRSYVSGSHFAVQSAFFTGRSDADYMFEIKNATLGFDEMYVEGQQTNGDTYCLDAVFKKQASSTIDIRAFKMGQGVKSKLLKGVVYDVSDDGSVRIGSNERSADGANLPTYATLQTVSGARRYYRVEWPGTESASFRPFAFEAAGGVTSTNDQLLAGSRTDALSKWEWSGSARKKSLATWDTAVTV
jgi:hypothetical protein